MLNFEKHLETLMKKDIKFAIIHPSKTDEKGNITMGHIKYTDELVEIIDDIRANDKSILLRSYRRVIDKELPLFEYSQESVEKLTVNKQELY